MNKNVLLALMLFVGFVMGFACSSLIGGTLGFGGSPPSGHANIAGQVTIYDSTIDATYGAFFVSSGQSKPLSVIPLTFTGQISYSKWEFRADPADASTVYAFMLIWGPGDAGEYFVEIGRLSTDGMTVNYPGGSQVWGKSGNDGFVYFLT